MPSERPLIVSEGNWLDDADRMLMSKQVDFREPRDRYSVSTLVKLGESQFAPGRLRTIRISVLPQLSVGGCRVTRSCARV